MSVKCPHCGLEGKAEEEILNRKIRCPKCKKIFIAMDTPEDATVVLTASVEPDDAPVSNDSSSEQNVQQEQLVDAFVESEAPENNEEPVEEQAVSPSSSDTQDTQLGETIRDEDIAVLGEDIREESPDEPAEGMFRCTCCGFTFSEQYRQDSDVGPRCAGCTVAGKTETDPV